VAASIKPRVERLVALPAVLAGAVLLRLIAGVGFANYDTLYALSWGGQLARGELPAYELPIAPTPHPLVEALGVVLYPLGPRATEDVVVWLGFVALAACGWVVYRLAALWFGRAAGLLAALILLTRVPIISYGVRAYVDVPYLLFVLSAVLVEAHRYAVGRRPAGAPVLALLALAGLLRPEAWAFSGVYWLYVVVYERRSETRTSEAPPPAGEQDLAKAPTTAQPPRSRRALAGLTLLAAAAPLVWVLSDLAIAGDALWSLTNTRHTAHTLARVTGIANVPEYVPRRIGEILRPPVLVGAALGGLLSLSWLRARAIGGALAGLLAVVVFIAVAAAGLPINTRYGFLTASILCVFCGAGVFGWTRLAADDAHRRWWMAGGAMVLVALIAFAPSQYKSAHRELDKLARQQSIQNDLLALVRNRSINLRCGPVEVPNHAPVPLLALHLKTSPANVVSGQSSTIEDGVYVDPASKEVEQDYVLDPRDLHRAVNVPPGFLETHANRSWLIFQHCA
jgi:4-amino-4-deoxy-L-arabinose transferase-like glycosyltransferase